METYFTQTPNVIFDELLKTLSGSELKVLLTIVRRTIGMTSKQHERVQRAWISQKLFMACTGLSNRAVSSAVASLYQKNLIVITDSFGHKVSNADERRRQSKLFYQVKIT